MDVKVSEIEIRKKFGMWMETIVEDDGITEGWVFQNIEGERTKINDIEDGFQKDLRWVKIKEVVLIPEGVEVGEYMSLRRTLRRGLTT